MKRVLVVDDQRNIRTLIRLTLQNHYRVSEADNGAHAMMDIERDRPDVVVLDLKMPGVYDGLSVLEWIRLWPERRDIPVIVVSGDSQEADEKLIQRLGVTAFLKKPFRPSDLLALLERLP